jgi:ligand-binding sensor domain-containing protein
MRGRVSRLFRQVGILGAAVLLAGAAASPSELGPRFAWRAVAEGVHGEAVSALAVRPGGAGLAVGDARGVRVAEPGGGFRRLLHRGPVWDLAFLPGGANGAGHALLAATAAGLYRVAAAGVRALRTAPGAEARSVQRVAVARGAVAVASDAGAFLSSDPTSDPAHWQRLSSRLPREPATAVALRERAGGLECFVVVGERLWRVALASTRQGWRDSGAAREPLPFARSGEAPVDVAFGLGGADVVVVLPEALAVRESDGAAWRVLRPTLPPGARARRLHAAHGLLWLATDRGLLVADALAGPWRRATGPAGTADVHSVASDASAVYVAAGERVLAARPVGRAAAGAALALRTPEGDPPIEQVQRAVLAYLGLRRERVDALRRGVSRRGWLPLVSLRLARARDEDQGVDFDESFSSGELHRLVDRDQNQARDFEATLTFTWDLGDVAYHPEEIDVSREAREVIKLRDDVLDEVTQLYFERRRVLAELFARPDAPPAERLRLRLRAAELAAGLDAWTGGWFGRARASAHPGSAHP